MSGITPKAVLIVGNGNVPILVDSQGVIFVSPPTQLQGGVEVSAAVLNTSLTGLVNEPTLAVSNFNYALDLLSQEWVNVNSVALHSSGPTNNAISTFAVLNAYNTNGSVIETLLAVDSTVDSFVGSTTGSFLTYAQQFGWDGAAYERVRVANVFHTVIATASGSTPVWTPTAGKKFRLMGYTIDVVGTTAATGTNTIKLEDSATVIFNHIGNTIQTPTASISGGADHISANLGQGKLSAVANNVLNVNLSVAMATGGVAVNVWGTEE